MQIPNYIAYAVPAFFVLIAVELFVLWRRERLSWFRFDDAITNLSCGIGQQVLGVLLKAGLVAVYAFVHAHGLRLLPEDSIWTWVAAFLGVDFAYYWWHRASHRVNFLWAIHAVHHQSEEYNLSVALRQAWFSSITAMAFYLPLAALGVPPLPFAAMLAFTTLYQFWIHTRVLPRLGPFEWVFNAPSHHRVHHACNPKYLDRNYAATLIVWDRLFGTFKDEEDEPVYGTVTPIASWNPLWANLWYWVKTAREAARMPRLRDRLAVWFAPPGWRPKALGGPVRPPEITRESQRKFATRWPRGVGFYVALQFVPTTVLGTLLMLDGEAPLSRRAVVAGVVLWTTLVWGALFERRAWAMPAELLRLAVVLVAAIAWASDAQGRAPAVAATIAFVALSAALLLRQREWLGINGRVTAAS